MQDDIQQAVEQLLAIERDANAIVERAKAEAQRLRSEGAEAAEAASQEALTQVRQMAEKMIADTKSAAEAERERKLAGNAQKLAEMERLAKQRKGAAVRFVIARLTGEVPQSIQHASRRTAA